MKKRSKKRFQKTRRVASNIARGGKGTLLEGGVGALIGYGQEFAEQKVSILRSKPWMTSAVLIGLGHLAKRKAKTRNIAPTLVACGGLLLGRYFKARNQPQTAGLDTGLVMRQFAPPAPARSLPSNVVDMPIDADEEDAGLVFARSVRVA